jgi:serine/threonine protein kinase
MGVVYLGYDDAGTAVAVKLIRQEHLAEPQFRARLRREVDAARRVPRFCTAPVLAADLDADRPWVATEYIEAPSLDVALLEMGRLRGEELERFAVGVAVALRAIHEHGVVHRDLKPSNVLLSQVGPRVIDFGIARVENATDLTQLTQTGAVVGTPAYMSPEQLRGEPLTTAVDVFAWAGLVAYAANGRAPFGSGGGVMHAILHQDPGLGELAEPLRGLVAAALAKDPAARPSADDLVDRLSQRTVAAQVLAKADAPPTGSVHTAPTLLPADGPRGHDREDRARGAASGYNSARRGPPPPSDRTPVASPPDRREHRELHGKTRGLAGLGLGLRILIAVVVYIGLAAVVALLAVAFESWS